MRTLLLLAVIALLYPAQARAQDGDPPPDAAADTPAEEEPIIEGPQIVEYVEAAYPPAAEEAGLEAVVRLHIELDEAGEVVNVEVVEPVGNGFDEAAVDAVLAMRFSPARTASGPVPVVFEFEYGFVLEPAPEEVEEQPAPVNFDGLVREMGTRKPIEGVRIVVADETVATTDAEGRFEARGIPLGEMEVRLVHSGHVTSERTLEFLEGQVTSATLWMRAEAYRDNEVVGTYERIKEEVTRRTVTIEEIRRVPGTFGDPVRVVQTLPGAARTPFGTGFLIIRGSDPEDSAVYIDGIRIPIIYHLTGTTSVLAPELIESVDYLPGSYGVHYGRSMGGVVDVKTRTEFEEDGKLVWGTDILDTQLYYEGKLGKKKQHGLAVGARRSYIDAFIPIFTGDTGFTLKPRYWDYQVKWAPDLMGDQSFSAFVYGFDDLLLIATPDDFAQGPDQDTQGDFRTQYNSHRLIAKYERGISETLRLELLPSAGIDSAYFGLGQEFVLDNASLLLQLRAQTPWTPSPHFELIPGLDFLGAFWNFDFSSAIRFSDFEDPLAEREPVSFGGNGTVWTPDLFVKANVRPLADTDRWLVTPGLRLNVVTLTQDGEIDGDEDVPPNTTGSVDPRLHTRFQVTESLAIKGGTGLYHQPPQPQEIVGVGTEATVGHERSWATSIGFEHRLTPAIHYDIDLFYKHMDELIVFDEDWDGFGSSPFTNDGDGRAYGLELIARHDRVGRFFGWLSYTLSRARRRDSPNCEPGQPDDTLDRLTAAGECWYYFDFDQTHILSAQGGYDLPLDFGVSAQVQYVTGNPFQPFDSGIYDADGDFYNGFPSGAYNTDRLPPFFQASFRADRLWSFKRWQLETYVDLLYLVRGVNPEFTIYNFDYSEFAYVRGLPFIPNIGIEAKFWL